jgi:hypothetical protein
MHLLVYLLKFLVLCTIQKSQIIEGNNLDFDFQKGDIGYLRVKFTID